MFFFLCKDLMALLGTGTVVQGFCVQVYTFSFNSDDFGLIPKYRAYLDFKSVKQ